jgi:hypothetical protein
MALPVCLPPLPLLPYCKGPLARKYFDKAGIVALAPSIAQQRLLLLPQLFQPTCPFFLLNLGPRATCDIRSSAVNHIDRFNPTAPTSNITNLPTLDIT